MKTHTLIASLLWLYKPNKPEYFNNHKHKLNTQHLNLFIRTMEISKYDVKTKVILFIQYYSINTEMIDE